MFNCISKSIHLIWLQLIWFDHITFDMEDYNIWVPYNMAALIHTDFNYSLVCMFLYSAIQMKMGT